MAGHSALVVLLLFSSSQAAPIGKDSRSECEGAGCSADTASLLQRSVQLVKVEKKSEEGHGGEAGEEGGRRRRKAAKEAAKERRRGRKRRRVRKRQAEWKAKAAAAKAARGKARRSSWKNIAAANRADRKHKRNGGTLLRPKVTCSKPVDIPSRTTYPEELMAEQCPNPVLTSTCISRSGYESISDTVRKQLKSISSRCDSKECPRADWAGCVLRMAGHDFMDFDPSSDPPSGGSDACTDLADADNMGLAPCLHDGEHGQALRSTYLEYCGHVSLADFLVIAAEAVMYETSSATQEQQKHVDFIAHFQWGRTTAKECTGAAYRLPNPTDGCKAVESVFMDAMGLTKRQATALMGVHTLGHARTKNSGLAGRWSDANNSQKFNNNYYKSLLKKGWRPMKKVCGNELKHQWVRQGPGPMPSGSETEMMLDTDMCLAYDIPKGARGEICCAWQDQTLGNKWERWEMCGGTWQGKSENWRTGPAKRTKKDDCSRKGFAASHVKEFAESESAWLKEFQKAWTIATTNGFSDLKSLNESCSWEP